ncbi:hypothetical protein WN48_10560 [Eufriesea mexicana]|nr:hypothetical protein WN48_10560 [Eufriesea mexicana]
MGCHRAYKRLAEELDETLFDLIHKLWCLSQRCMNPADEPGIAIHSAERANRDWDGSAKCRRTATSGRPIRSRFHSIENPVYTSTSSTVFQVDRFDRNLPDERANAMELPPAASQNFP